jgi:hypothetical protein
MGFLPNGFLHGFSASFSMFTPGYEVSEVGSVEMVDLVEYRFSRIISSIPVYTIKQFSKKPKCVNMAKLSYPLKFS